jgi:hypothetical protein
MRKANWTDAEFKIAVAKSISVAGVLRCIGLVPKGGNYRTVRAKVKELGLSTKHWLGLAHLRGQKRILPKQPLAEVLVENSTYSRACLKARLLREGLLPSVCALCGQTSTWFGKPLVLELDHVNGVNNDNRLSNLRLLCPNCHSQQPTFCGANNKGKTHMDYSWKCEDCGRVVSRDSRWCVSCSRLRSRRVVRPTLSVLLRARKTMSMEAVGRKYGVSGTTIKKWIWQATLAKLPREASAGIRTVTAVVGAVTDRGRV